MDNYYEHIDISKFRVTLKQLESDSIYHPFEPVAVAEADEGTFFRNTSSWQQSIVTDISQTRYIERVIRRYETILGTRLIEDNKVLLDLIAVRYYRQAAGTEVPWHCDFLDSNTANNFLFDPTSQPFTFEDIGDVPYSCTLFNTAKMHMVKAGERDRLMLRVTPRNIDYGKLHKLMLLDGMF